MNPAILNEGSSILITGGAGFIGANLVRLLLKNNYLVTVLDDLRAGAPSEYLEGLNVNLIEGDILDEGLVEEVVPRHDGIVHLAAQSGVPASLVDPVNDCYVNVFGTLKMLEAARKHGVKRFIFASSNAPLGRQIPPATEEKAPLPVSPYGASKLAGEAYCLAYHGSWGLGTTALRFANVYGPYSAHKSSVVAKFFRDVASRGEITLDGGGRQTRDFIYVDDLCRAILLALRSGVGGEVFQLATGNETSIEQLAELVKEIVDAQVSVVTGPQRQGDVQRSYSSIDKARLMLEWEPKVQLKTGLEHTWRWTQQWVTSS